MSGLQPNQTCGTCVFYDRINVGQGLCRCRPPTGAAVATSRGILKTEVFPPVASNNKGCGEYQQDYSIEGGNGED